MQINMNEFFAGMHQQQRFCKDITAEVEVSPSPYDLEAYAEWKNKEAKKLEDKENERQKRLPMVVNKK